MNPTWEVAFYHFKREVFKKSYLLTLLSLPFFLAITIGLGQLAARANTSDLKVGVVDPAGFIQITAIAEREDEVEVLFFDSREAAEERLKSKNDPINAVYVLAADYPANREMDMLYVKFPPSVLRDYFADLLRVNVLADQPAELANRVLEGQSLTVRASAVNREFHVDGPTADLFIPLMLAVVYIFTIFPIAGIMVGALGDEKINRTIEVIVTSISPKELIRGKVIAVSGIALMQVIIWILFLIFAVFVSANWFDVGFFQDVTVRWRDVGAIALLAIPGFIFYSATLIMIGSLINDAESLSQASGLIFFPLFLPMYVIPILLENPNGTVAQIFSFLPFTSVQTIGLQSLFMEVPVMRIGLSLIISWLITAGMVWLAVRAFRMGMLRYGKRVKLRELFVKTPVAS